MYEQHWNVLQKPFDNYLERAWYYPAECHQGAMLKLRYAIESHRGAAVLAGGAGMGKTLMVNQLLGLLPRSFAPAVHLVFPQMPADQLLSFLVQELCGGEISEPSDQNIVRLKRFLAENSEAGQHAMVAIDEAHLIQDRKSIEMLRLLLNFQSAGKSDLTLLLVGQPQLLASLERLSGFEDRIAVKCLLRAFTADETAGYISHRMTTAHAERIVFTDDAMQAIHELAHGTPSRINRLCDLALLIGFAEGKSDLDAGDIAAVSRELFSVAEETQSV